MTCSDRRKQEMRPRPSQRQERRRRTDTETAIDGNGVRLCTYVEERDATAVGGAHQLVPVPRVPLPVGGLERGEEWLRLRRRRERQQLLPEHEVLPHPAPDDLGEPPAHGEAQRVPVRAAAGVEGVQLATGAHVSNGFARCWCCGAVPYLQARWWNGPGWHVSRLLAHRGTDQNKETYPAQ